MKGCTISALCRLSGLSRQAFYKQRRHRQRQDLDEALVISLVWKTRAMHPRMGTLKLHQELSSDLHREGVALGRDRLNDVLKRHDLLVKPKPPRSIRTTYCDSALPVYRNLLYELSPTLPHQVWVSDITYIDTDAGFLYLSLITDLTSRKIVGWHLADTLEAKQCITALKMAIAQLPEGRWPIHHSDRGCQYCCHDYVKVLNDHDLPISMTEQNHCYENSNAERVNGILKDEYYLGLRFRSRAQAHQNVAQAIHLYNVHRPHRSLNMRKPAAVHQLAA